ncbi:MAG: hypothetical protein ATN31_02460 [Candidatus Epulonipiscioides saccharophilum]|nr:MAG: hypothetical protein ATN31_02460 [Epulopiscium sp. AS2M-Bin001]
MKLKSILRKISLVSLAGLMFTASYSSCLARTIQKDAEVQIQILLNNNNNSSEMISNNSKSKSAVPKNNNSEVISNVVGNNNSEVTSNVVKNNSSEVASNLAGNNSSESKIVNPVLVFDLINSEAKFNAAENNNSEAISKEIVNSNSKAKANVTVNSNAEAKVNVTINSNAEAKVNVTINSNSEAQANVTINSNSEAKVNVTINSNSEEKSNEAINFNSQPIYSATINSNSEEKSNEAINFNSQPIASATVNSNSEPTSPAIVNSNSEMKSTEVVDPSISIVNAIANLGADILKTENKLDNISISPLSIAYALAMTANGAAENTLVQMENLLGHDISGLNTFLQDYTSSLPDHLNIANAIWYNNSGHIHIEPSFIEKNKTYYEAIINQVVFDSNTHKVINKWIEENTLGLIKDMLAQPLPPSTIMCLVNALAFEGSWTDAFEKYNIKDDIFTNASGEKQTGPFMSSNEKLYISTENAVGFKKYYDDFRYSFVALLPDDINDFIQNLDMSQILHDIEDTQRTAVKIEMPKFNFKYDLDLTEILPTLGISDAFNPVLANFKHMGASDNGNLYIGKALHSTTMDVNENGTVATAATIIMMMESAMFIPAEEKIIKLDKPFFFMIMDEKNSLPIFVGVLNSLN